MVESAGGVGIHVAFETSCFTVVLDQRPISASDHDETSVCLFQGVLADAGKLHDILLLQLKYMSAKEVPYKIDLWERVQQKGISRQHIALFRIDVIQN